MFKARVRREKPRGAPVNATVHLNPYQIPFGLQGLSLIALEGALKTYGEALVALREAGAPDAARVMFIAHAGYFGDRGNSLIEAVEADWIEPAAPAHEKEG